MGWNCGSGKDSWVGLLIASMQLVVLIGNVVEFKFNV